MTETARELRLPSEPVASSPLGPGSSTIAACESQLQDLLIAGNSIGSPQLLKLERCLGELIEASRLESGAPALSAGSCELAVVLREQVGKAAQLGGKPGQEAAFGAAMDEVIPAAANLLWTPEMGQVRISQPAPDLDSSRVAGAASEQARALLGAIPQSYHEYLPQMERLAAILVEKRAEFDLCVFTGRSGVGMGVLLREAGIACVELPPLRLKAEGENRPAIPTALEAVREQIAGKRVLFVDDQVGGSATLQYARLLTHDLGGTFVGAAMYRSKYDGETGGFLLPPEKDLETGLPGRSDGGIARPYPSVGSLFGGHHRQNPFISGA